MTREEFIKQRCEIDKITEEEFEKTYRVVKCNCGKIYCRGYRCLDLDGLLKENQELKKQVETYEIEGYKQNEELDKMSFDIRKYKTQQKEFIKYLEDEIKKEKDNLEKLCELYKITKENNATYKFAYSYIKKMEEILQKYKSIIGENDV